VKFTKKQAIANANYSQKKTKKCMTNVSENTNPFSDLSIIRAKDLSMLTSCGEKTAYKLLRDIKDEYHLKRVLYFHVKKYLAIA
jgi:hypothetical protein